MEHQPFTENFAEIETINKQSFHCHEEPDLSPTNKEREVLGKDADGATALPDSRVQQKSSDRKSNSKTNHARDRPQAHQRVKIVTSSCREQKGSGNMEADRYGADEKDDRNK